MSDTYTCEQCNGVFGKGWSDEDARDEQTKNGFDDFACAIVCDDCYKKIMAELDD